MKESPVNIMDVTVKEGGFRVNHRLLPEHVANIAQALSSAGIKFAELSHGCGIGSFNKGYPGLYPDEDMLAAARDAAPDLKICAYIYPSLHSVPEIPKLTRYIDAGRIAINPDELDMARPHIEELAKAGKQFIAQIQRVHLFSADKIISTALAIEKMGASVIYLTDSFGSLSPKDVEHYFRALQPKVHTPLGFQAKNTQGFAVANSLTAYQAGASWLDASVSGMGIGSGMAPLEILVALFQKEGLIKEIQLNSLNNILRHHVLPVYHLFPHVTHAELVLAKHRVDYYPNYLLERIAEILDLGFEEFIADLKSKEKFTQLRERELRSYLAKESLDFDVILNFIRTGKIPGQDDTES